jgi:hypothetical protein
MYLNSSYTLALNIATRCLLAMVTHMERPFECSQRLVIQNSSPKTKMNLRLLVCSLLLCAAVPAFADSIGTVTVAATSDIFGAGSNDAPSPGGDFCFGVGNPAGCGGSTPIQINLSSGSTTITFASVTGAIGSNSTLDTTADGYSYPGGTNVSSYGSISGCRLTGSFSW